MTRLAAEYGITRQTAYKWLGRFRAEGYDGLQERSRAPLHRPHATPDAMVELLVAAKKRFPTWGPKKLVAWIAREFPDAPVPAPSTAGELLKQLGYVKARRRRRHRVPPYTQPLAHCHAPNDLWCADLKGHFPVDGRACYPLTVTDAVSRYLIRCQGGREPNAPWMKEIFTSAFREFGMPLGMRTDNGPPFASLAVGGLSKLSIWWVKLGIRHERIEPAKPQQNGRHERMHLTLKRETASPPKKSMVEQQRAFDRFRRIFNDERPHEGVGQVTPSSLYTPSRRVFPEREPRIEYAAGLDVRRLRHDGYLRWRTKFLYLSESLGCEDVAVLRVDERFCEVYFGPVLLGRFDDTIDEPKIIRPKRKKRIRTGKPRR